MIWERIDLQREGESIAEVLGYSAEDCFVTLEVGVSACLSREAILGGYFHTNGYWGN